MDVITQDLRSAVRSLRRAPGLSALVVFSLALGIGANTAIFGLARSVLFEPVPYRDADRVVFPELQIGDVPVRTTEWQAAVIARMHAFDRVEAFSAERVDWRRGNSTIRLMSQFVTPHLPAAMGLLPLVGRGFVEEDANSAAEPVALISERLWRRELGSPEDVVGTTLVLAGTPRTVVGVSRAPRSAAEDVDIWIPRKLNPTGEWRPRVVAWLRPGVSLEQANAELQTLAPALVTDAAAPLVARLSRPGDRPWSSIDQTMLVVWGASVFVLTIVCGNLASLLLARNIARRRELGIRAALGASRASIVRQLIVETLLLGTLGGAAALLAATWGTAALLALRPRSLSLVYPEHVPLDATMMGYGVGIALMTGLFVGAAPALRAARRDLVSSIRQGDPDSERLVSGRWLFRGAVALQTALALMLLVGAGLLITSYVRLLGVAPGFEPDDVVEMVVELDPEVQIDARGRRDFFRRLAAAVGKLDGVAEASVAADAPPHGSMMLGEIQLADRPSAPRATVEASRAHVAPSYFRVLRIPLLEGRALIEQDARHGSVVVSQSFARKLWPRGSAVGQRFRLRREDAWRPWMHVVGVVGDVTGRGLRDTSGEIYLPYATDPAESGTILARVTREPSDLFQSMKEQVWALDPDLPIARITTLRDRLGSSIDEQPFYATLLATFALTALALAAVGVFGVTSYVARHRTREIGIRIALGARARDVERLVVVQGFAPSLVGLVVGVAGALALGQVMRSLVSEVSVTDARIYVPTALTLAALSLIATWLPARRAGRIDPIRVLRNE